MHHVAARVCRVDMIYIDIDISSSGAGAGALELELEGRDPGSPIHVH